MRAERVSSNDCRTGQAAARPSRRHKRAPTAARSPDRRGSYPHDEPATTVAACPEAGQRSANFSCHVGRCLAGEPGARSRHLPERDLDEAALRQGRCTGSRFGRTIALAMTWKYHTRKMRGLIRWHQDRGCREKQKPIESHGAMNSRGTASQPFVVIASLCLFRERAFRAA
jgi:hypothetical protein